MEFRLESYGPGDDRVLRYLNGAIIKETPVQHYFTLVERLKNEEKEEEFLKELHKLNCTNWNMVASTICMASSLSAHKELPLDWEESKMDQANGYGTLSKIKGIFDNLIDANKLQLSHTVTKHESKTLKYSIFNRNEKLDELQRKTSDLSTIILKSLKIQVKFLETVREIKKEFKVLVSHRNPVDLTSLDVDYPTSFSINVLFFDISYNPGKVSLTNYRTFTEDKPEKVENYKMEPFDSQKDNVWDLWELHSTSSPYSPQQCLVSYYESEDDDLLTRLTFPQPVSHFIEKDYSLSINLATLPLYEGDESQRLLYHLRRGRACLIDRFIFCVLAQFCYCNVKAGKHLIQVGDSEVFIDYISSESILLMCEGVEMEVCYRPSEQKETGDTMWKLLIAKLRDIHVQNWKMQKFELNSKTHNLLGEFLKYSIKLIRYSKNKFNK